MVKIAAMLANGEDSYEPDDCPLLAHVLTGPMRFNFFQLGNAEIWWWNAGADRMVYVRATELRDRADCGNSECTASLISAFTEKP